MFDLKWIRDNSEAFDAAMAKRGLEPKSAEILELDEARRKNVSELQEFQTRRNAASKGIGKAKGSGDEETAQKLMAEVASLKTALAEGEEKEREISAKLNDFLSGLPNLPHEDVPEGGSEDDNRFIREVGTVPEFSFEPKQHFDIGENLGLMDFEAATKLSGARFVVLKGALAKLERALAAFMVDVHTNEFGYEEVIPPFLVQDQAMYGTAQLPKFADDQYRTENGFWLIPTAEVPLTNLVRESIIDEDKLPIRMTAYTPCFRMEAGSAGRDTRGMIRQHQFSKVEMVSIVHPDKAIEEHERMTGCAEEILKKLGIAYRVMLLCTGDLGFGARKTYDLEVWLPGQNTYREISSCSVCGDFQARRMNARFRPKDSKDIQYVHTLNGSGLAVGRTMVALLENYQQEDGSVIIPEVLRPYMGGLEKIEAK
ncbi:MAG: serine--tRNA ligase [Methyloligellaceae bacterium]